MLDIKGKLESLNPTALVERLLEFIRVESPTGQEGAAGDYYARHLKEIGMEVTLDEVAPRRNNVRGRLQGTGQGPTLVLFGYLDTVPSFGCVSPCVKDGKVWGRGAQDMKAGLIAQAEAVRWLKDSGLKLTGDILIVAVVDHETPVGKKMGPMYFRDQILSGQISPDAIINTVGPRKVWIASLGLAIVRLQIQSKYPSAHPYSIPLRENPVFATGQIIHALSEINERLAKEEPDPLCGPSFISLGMVRGGDYPFRLPKEDCIIEGSWSWTSRYSLEMVRRELEGVMAAVSQDTGLKIDLTLEATREPFKTSPTDKVVIATREAERKITGQPGEIFGTPVTGDAHFYRNDCGVPTIYYGPGYETAHSDYERVDITDFVHLTKLLALTAIEFCGLSEV